MRWHAIRVPPPLIVLALLLGGTQTPALPQVSNVGQGEGIAQEQFEITFGDVGITGLRRRGDAYPTQYVRRGRPLGEVVVHYRASGDSYWSEALTRDLEFTEVEAGEVGRALVWDIRPGVGRRPESIAGNDVHLRLRQSFRLEDERLVWDLQVENESDVAVEIGGLGMALDIRGTGGGEDVRAIYENNVVKHHFISGHGSWIFWQRPNGVGPYLVMTPREGTWLEYFERTDQVRNAGAWPWFYIHSGLNGSMETRGTWRQAHTNAMLAPRGAENSSVEHGFEFRWAADYREVRDVVYEAGLVDVTVAPGMTVPTDREVRLALRTRRAISVEAEFPDETEIEYLGTAAERAATTGGDGPPSVVGSDDAHLYRITFSRLGENALIVRWPESEGREQGTPFDAPDPDALQARAVQALQANRPMVPGPTGAAWDGTAGPGRVATSSAEGPRMMLEFFVTEPVNTLLRKRSAHIALKQQHRDDSKWYDGLFSVWDMRGDGTLRGPDDTDGFDGWWGYVLAADDPGLSKAPLVAAENARWPDRAEIEALDYYVENYVWGGLQRTDEEHPYPYGVYGVPNWFVNRNSPFGFGSGGMGQEHVFRMYDYPHITMLYWHLYRIARIYPEWLSRSADEYLDRAYETARAYFIYPYEILPWYEVYKWGTMNEVVIVDVLAELERLDRTDEAAFLRGELEKKAKYFVYDDPYPFRSEYSFDSTGFESSAALAAWALTGMDLEPKEDLWFDENRGFWMSHTDVSDEDARELLERQLAANIALRGRLEPTFYYTGSDYRGGGQEGYTLSYMSHMGGWGVLDYVVRFAADPDHVAWMECRGLLDGSVLPESRVIERRLESPLVPDCSNPGAPSDAALLRARARKAELARLASASLLSSFALMNTSTDGATGYWAPGEANEGATGWAFKSEKFGQTWIRKETDRGPWFYDGEIDLGYGAALRMLDLLDAAGPLEVEDPVLGPLSLGTTQLHAPPAELDLDPFYRKYVDAAGIPVISSEKVPDAALWAARSIIEYMSSARPDVRTAMIERGQRVGIMAQSEMQMDLPEYRDWTKPAYDDRRLTPGERERYNEPGGIASMTAREYWNRRARGMGGRYTTAAEENILGYPGTRYYGEHILVHEFSHAVMGAVRTADPELYQEIEEAYADAKAAGRFAGHYAENTVAEYWAEGSQWWFWSNYEWYDGDTRLQTPDDLKSYDPRLYAIFEQVYPGHEIPGDIYHGKNIRPARRR